jgi:ABC-2 type transport system permease protein
MAGMRWRMFVNSLRSKLGAIELGARTVAFVIYAAMGLALGAGMGVGAYALVSNEKWEFLPILFWVAFLLWQVVPVMLASFQEQFDLGILLRFPVSFGSYFLLYVVFGLVDVSTILGVLCCLGIWAGLTLARPDLSAWAALVLMVFAAFNILLVRAVFAWIDRWLAQRKTREILGVVFMVLMLSMQLLNPALHQMRRKGYVSPQQRAEDYRQTWNRVEPWVKPVFETQEWLPPGLAARALGREAKSEPALGIASLGVLGLWGLAMGMVLAGRLRAEYRGENLSSAPSRAKAAASRAALAQRESGWRFGGSGPITAIMEKEARSIRRTLPLLWALGVPVLIVLVFVGSLLRNGPAGGGSSFSFALPLCVASTLMGFVQLFFNNLGTEGAGIQLLFLSPTPIRTVLLAKNLFHSLLFAVDVLLVGYVATLRVGRPESVMVAATVAWLLFALPCNLAAGNLISLTMPYRINPGRIGKQRGAQANSLLSMLTLLVLLGISAPVFALAYAWGNLLLAVPVFLALAVVAGFFWLRGLANSDALANRRRDTLIAILMKTQ